MKAAAERNQEEIRMERNTGITGQQLLSCFMVISGSVLLLWFSWPAFFKGIINIGNVCGVSGSLALIVYGVRYPAVHQLVLRLWHNRPARAGLLIFAAAVAGMTALVCVAAVSVLQAGSSHIPENTPAVVLGCSVKGKRPSRILQERIDAAVAYMAEHPQSVCVLSGGQGKGEDIPEAECMYQEMVRSGVDPQRLYMESESVNTQQNLAYSEKILEELGLTGKVTVISSGFHLYRGRFWAEKAGYGTYGYGAATDWRYLPTYFLREIIAVIHLWLVN